MATRDNTQERNGAFIELMNDPTKKLHESKNFLASLTRKIFFDMGIGTRQYFTYIERWLKKRYKDVDKNVQKISSDRNNFYKEVSNDVITPNVFQKVTQSLGAVKVNLTVELEFDDGRPNHTSTISFINSSQLDEETHEDKK